MSAVYAIESAAVGVNGATVWIEAGTEFATTDAVVKAHPGKFTADVPEVEEPVRRTKRGRS